MLTGVRPEMTRLELSLKKQFVINIIESTMSQLKCLMFDVDGTLANTEEAHRQAFNAIFKQTGLDWHWDQPTYKRLLRVSGGVERMLHFMDENQLSLDTDDVTGFVKDMHKRKTVYYNELLQKGEIRLRVGVARLIEEARRQSVRLAITTTTTRLNVETLLRVNLGEASLQWFEVWVCGEEVKRKKPDPEVYTLALQALDLPASQCIALEDSYNGVRAACAAHIACLVTPNEYTDEDDFSGAFSVVSQLGDDDSPAHWISGEKLAGEKVELAALDQVLAQRNT